MILLEKFVFYVTKREPNFVHLPDRPNMTLF